MKSVSKARKIEKFEHAQAEQEEAHEVVHRELEIPRAVMSLFCQGGKKGEGEENEEREVALVIWRRFLRGGRRGGAAGGAIFGGHLCDVKARGLLSTKNSSAFLERGVLRKGEEEEMAESVDGA